MYLRRESVDLVSTARRGRGLGETVDVCGDPHVVTQIDFDGSIYATRIPDGMTAMDLGRKFQSARRALFDVVNPELPLSPTVKIGLA